MTKLRFILLGIFFINNAIAQNTITIAPVNPIIHAGQSVTLTASGASSYLWGPDNLTPLNQVSDDQLAVGLRQLKTAYTGPSLRIRRGNDNAEADFGFEKKELDITAINTFLGTSTGYCTILYDQSGKGNNMIQPNASQQPALVINGLNNKPVLHFNTSQTMYNLVNFEPPYSVIYAARQTGPTRRRVLQGQNNWLLGWWNGSMTIAYFEGWVRENGTPANSDPYVYTGTGTGSISSFYQNGAFIVSNSGGLRGPNGITLNGGESSDADVAEIFVFNKVLSDADRQKIENSSGSYYAIFGEPQVAGSTYQVTPASTTTYYVKGSSANGDDIGTASTTVTVLNDPGLSAFTAQSKMLLDGSYTITAPKSNSPGNFTYFSSNPAIATISGSTVNILAAGNTTIRAVQAANGNYYGAEISADLTVNSVEVITKNGKITTNDRGFVNKNGALGNGRGLNKNGKSIIALSKGDGLTSANPSSSAYQIKQDYPESTDGLYWISNESINNGVPFQIYADMTTDGGGWTLILCNASNGGWNYENAISLNAASPSISSNYSIIKWANYIKKSASGFQYMIDANQRRSYGAIWTANGAYSFINNNNTQTDITINQKFGSWEYNDAGIEKIMPWYSNCSGYITTSFDCGGGSWWGTLVSQSGWRPAPWISSSGGMADPGIIWYWVR